MPPTATIQPPTVDEVKTSIVAKHDAQEAFCLHFPVNPDGSTLHELEAMLESLPCSKTARWSYTAVDGLVVRWTPGGTIVDRRFMSFIHDLFNDFLRPQSVKSYKLFVCCGSATQRIGKEFNTPDDSFFPVADGAGSPTVIIQVCASEQLEYVRSDALWWLTSPEFQVKLVIITAMAAPPQNSTTNNPVITIEHWEMVEDVPTQVYSGNWTETVPNEGDYQLPTEAFAPDSDVRARYNLPRFLFPSVAYMQSLREGIIIGWRYHHT